MSLSALLFTPVAQTCLTSTLPLHSAAGVVGCLRPIIGRDGPVQEAILLSDSQPRPEPGRQAGPRGIKLDGKRPYGE